MLVAVVLGVEEDEAGPGEASTAALDVSDVWRVGIAAAMGCAADGPWMTGAERMSAVTAEDSGGPTDDDWQRFGQTVEKRRLERGYSQEQLVKRGGPSHQTVRNIERGLPADYRATTYRNIDRSLDWRHGTAEKVLRGTATDEDVAAVEVWPGLAERVATSQEPCACVVGSAAWVERELATERRINAIAEVFRGEVARLLALVEAARR